MGAPRTQLPDKKTAPKEKDRDSILNRENFADKEKTVEEVTKLSKQFFYHFDGQNAREHFTNLMDKADEMTRLAASQSKQTENNTRDNVDTRPDIVWRILRAVASNESDVLVPAKDPIAQYAPINTVDPLIQAEGEAMSTQRQMLLGYSMQADKRDEKLRDAIFFLNKYGNLLISMEWLHETKEVPERQIEGGRNKKGDPRSLKWKKVKKTRQHPTLGVFDMKDVWLDSAVDGVQGQQCVLTRRQTLYANLLSGQADGRFKNVQKLTDAERYKGEDPSEELGDRQQNAGEGQDASEETGQFDEWNVWIRAPIDEKTGEWNAEKYPPKLYWATFVGSLPFGKPVCVRLIRNPYSDDEIPYYLWHALRDDKGAYHVSIMDLLTPGYDEYKTTLDQRVDNKNLINSAPMVTEDGAILNRDKSFGPRKLITMKRGKFDRLKRLEIPNNTADTMEFLRYLEERLKETGGASKPILGEALGGRTSASEARNVFDQAIKPAIDKLRYEATAIEWIAEKEILRWQQFAPTDLVMTLTHEDMISEVKPAHLYGDFRVKVNSVDEYERNTVQRAEEDRFLDLTLRALPEDPEFRKKAVMSIWRKRGLPVDDWNESEPVNEFDAMHVARSENIELFDTQIWDQPKPEENHAVHLREHKQFRDLNKVAGIDNPEGMRLLDSHIVWHEQLMQQAEQAQMGAASQGGAIPGMGSPDAAPSTAGEVAQNLLGAEGGAVT